PLKTGNNLVHVVVVSGDGANTNTYRINITRVGPDQVIPDQTGDAPVDSQVTQVVVVSPTLPVNITIPAGTTAPTSVVYGNLMSQGTGTVPQTTVTSAFTQMDIPASTLIKAENPGWDGVLVTPIITTYNLPAIPGQIITPGLIIEVGNPDFPLSFDKAVRLKLIGQAGMRVARVHNNVYAEILKTGTEDSQAAGDALPADGTFKISVANDMIIWTKVFSKFITFRQKTDLNIALVEADKAALTEDLIRAS